VNEKVAAVTRTTTQSAPAMKAMVDSVVAHAVMAMPRKASLGMGRRATLNGSIVSDMRRNGNTNKHNETIVRHVLDVALILTSGEFKVACGSRVVA